MDFAAAIALVVFAWWISTGAVLYLVGMPRLTYPLTMGAITLALAMAFLACGRSETCRRRPPRMADSSAGW